MLKNLIRRKEDRTEKWLEMAQSGKSPLPYVLNSTQSILENEIRQFLLDQMKIYRKEVDFAKYPHLRTFR
jgi:hypothetical protein